jgi:hypothetical protein
MIPLDPPKGGIDKNGGWTPGTIPVNVVFEVDHDIFSAM